MTNRRARSGWYVTARVGHLTNYLCGPFKTARAAALMMEPVRRAALRWQPGERMRQAQFGFARSTQPGGGTLPLEFIDPADVIDPDNCA